MKFKAIGVFCGSAIGKNEIYTKAACDLGKAMANESISLIYGGASVGLMGVLADSTLENNGHVVGIIPDFFSKKEIAHSNLHELIYVPSMQERKRLMADRSDAFIVLPGGFGTLDEMFEMLTFSQLDLHQKLLGILNINGYYDALIKQIEFMNKEGFVRDNHLSTFVWDNTVDGLLNKMQKHTIIHEEKWLKWAKE